MTPIQPPPFKEQLVRPPPLRPRVIEEKRGMRVPVLILSVTAGILLAMFLACAGMSVFHYVIRTSAEFAANE